MRLLLDRTMLRLAFVAWALLLPWAPRALAQSIEVRFEPSSNTVLLGQTFAMDIIASAPADLAFVGWGMDVTFDSSVLFLNSVGAPDLGPAFDPLPAFGDGDGLSGLILPPDQPIWGSDILLATLSFTAVQNGTTNVVGSITPSDPLEGFVIPGGTLAPVVFDPAVITVIPSPPGITALAVCALFGRKHRRR